MELTLPTNLQTIKDMNKKYIIAGLALSITLMIASCVKDLNVKPKDPTKIMSGNLADNPEYYAQVLGKIYASFLISGQKPDWSQSDISASDADFFTTGRALWNLQEITTDESICAWGDVGISDLNTQTWSPSNPFPGDGPRERPRGEDCRRTHHAPAARRRPHPPAS